jgi:hypothetical protein
LNESKDFENSENRETYKENDSIGDERNVIWVTSMVEILKLLNRKLLIKFLH